jgi:hypothetical protein
MLDANGVYYAIAFYPEEGDVTKPRTIDVRLRNHADLSVRAQRGYDLRPTDAAAAGVARPVIDALTAPAPPTAIPVVARADFAGSTADGALATLHVYVDGDRLEYRQEGEQRAFDLEVATAVFDESGASVDMKVESLAGKLAPRAFDLARANGFHVTRQAVLKPGRYQLRVAVRETATGRIGTSSAWVDVPDLGKGQLALGAVTLTGSHSAGGAVFVPRTPHGLRTFAVGDFLIYSLAAFNPAGESDTLMRIAILSGDRVVYRSAWEPIASRVTDRRDRTARISGQLQLGGTPPGAYTLRVEVQDPGRKQTVAQTAAFGVERP